MSRRLVASLIVAVLLPGTLRAQERAGGGDPGAAIDRIFSRWAQPASPGCALAVGRAGAPLVARAYGMADLEHGVPNTVQTVFEAGSVSKQFTAAAIILLAQSGQLSLDDDVRVHIPELPEYEAPITIRHLLHHTSGLRDWGTVAEAGGWPRTTRAHTNAHALDIISRQRALNYTPGAEYSYTNSGYNLMAIIVERVSGESLADFTRRRLFEPLGMEQTGWRDDFTRIVPGRATAYRATREGFSTLMPFEDVHGNGGLLTTVGDLLIWNDNLESGRVGGRALLEELHRRGRLNDGRELTYAAGLIVDEYRGIPEVSHSGSTAGYQAFLTRFPEQRLSVAVLCNVTGTNPGALAHEAADVFLPAPAPAKAAAAPRPVRLARPRLESLVGMYRNLRTREPLRVTMVEGALRMGPRTELVPLADTLFQVGSGGSRLVVERARDGAPRALRLVAPDGDVVRYEPVAEARPTPAELAAYQGEYRSEEAEVTYQIVLVGDALELRRRPGGSIKLAPAYADAFSASSGWLVDFRRNAAGEVVAMTFGMGRVRELVLARVAL